MTGGVNEEDDEFLESALDASESTDSVISRHLQKLFIDLDEDPDDYLETRIEIVKYIVKKFITIATQSEFFHSLYDVNFLPADESSAVLFTTRIKPTLKSIDTNNKLTLLRVMMNGLEVFVKFNLQAEGARFFQNVEKRMYKTVINDLALDRISPHFMLYYHHFDIRNIDRFVGMHWLEFPKEYNEKFHQHYVAKLSEISLERPDATILLLESGHGITFDTLLSQLRAPGNVEHLWIILFQLMYTLTCMDLEGLTHYDLHLGNVFLEELKVPLTCIYFLDSFTWVKVTSNRWFAKIFDWEFAYHQSVNTKREKISMKKRACPEVGVCPQHNPKCDLWRVLWYLIEDSGGALPIEVQNWITSGMNMTSNDPNVNLMLRKQIAAGNEDFRADYLCFIPDGQECDGPLEASDVALKRASWYLNAMKNVTVPGIQWGKLPEYDPAFLPNEAQWSNVFAVTSDLRNKVARKLERIYKL